MRKYNHLIIFLFLSIGIGLAIFGAFFFTGKARTALDKQERVKLEHQIQEEQIKNLPELAKTYQSILEKEQFFSFLYSEDRVVEIIKDIESLAKEESVTLTITQREVPKKKAVKKEEDSKEDSEEEKEEGKTLEDSLPYEKNIRLELKAEGQYLAVRNFLHKIETAPYALDVLSLNATLAPANEEGNGRPVSTDTPFLLGGNVASEEEPSRVSQEKVIAIMETALYVQ